MVLFDLKIKLSPEKSATVLQSFWSMIEPVLVQPECRHFRVCCDSQDDDTVYISQAWETRQALERHIASEDFRVILAAMDLGVKAPEINFFTATKIEGFEFVENVRAVA